MANRLVVVSNRVPLPAETQAESRAAMAAGGMPGIECDVLWFGWSGRISGDPRPALALWSDPAITLAAVDLTTRQYEGYFNGLSDGTLWPHFAELTGGQRFPPEGMALHRAVNAVFAAQLAPLLRPGDRVWVQDYHLIPLASMLRELGIDAPIGFFPHTAFPPAENLTTLPWRREIAADLAAFDLIGFQTKREQCSFVEFMLRTRRDGARIGDGRPLGRLPAIGIFPLGIHARAGLDAPGPADMGNEIAQLTRHLDDRHIIVGADRLDDSKSLADRFRGVERLLDGAPELRGKCCLLQVTTPPMTLTPGHLERRMEQQAQALRINQRLACLGWMPIYDISLQEDARSALLRLSRAGLATAPHNGVNLAAREYVAAQHHRDPGVLILSRHAEAAGLLTEALLVDPADPRELADALRAALGMSLGERQDRWRRMLVKLLHHEAEARRHSFLGSLGAARAAREAELLGEAAPEPPEPPIRLSGFVRSRSAALFGARRALADAQPRLAGLA